MPEHLWATWRHRYVTNHARETAPPDPGDGRTLFERVLAEPDDEAAGVVARGELVSVVLNAYPYGSGHVLVLPNRGAASLADLTVDEARSLWGAVDHAVNVIQDEYDAPGVNVGLNQGRAAGAGVPDHLHVHVLPRWDGDTNFMTSVADTRVHPEPLDATWRRLRTAWGQRPNRLDP